MAAQLLWASGTSNSPTAANDLHRIVFANIPNRDAVRGILHVLDSSQNDLSHMEPPTAGYYLGSEYSCLQSYCLTYSEVDSTLQGLVFVGRPPAIRQGEQVAAAGRNYQRTDIGWERRETPARTRASSVHDNLINRFPTDNDDNPDHLPLQDSIDMTVRAYSTSSALVRNLKLARQDVFNSAFPLWSMRSLTAVRSQMFSISGPDNYFENFRGANRFSETQVSASLGRCCVI